MIWVKAGGAALVHSDHQEKCAKRADEETAMQIASESLPRTAAQPNTGGLWSRWKQRWARMRADARLREELRHELRW